MPFDIDHHIAVFRRGADELLVESELRAKLARGNPLNVKEGFDPTRPDLHLGHTVQFNKLRQLQDLGHHIVFLVGDFTSLIGDVKNGERMSFTSRPGAGVEVAVRDQVKGTIPGDEFSRTLFTVWFGPKPGDENLKRGMLGK